MPERAPATWRLAAAFAIVYLVWGSTYLAIAYAIESIPPLLMAGARFLLAGAILYAFARLRRTGAPSPGHWRSALILGILFFLFGNGTVVWVEQVMPSGVVALIVALVSVWTVLLEWVWPGGVRPTAMALAGVALGFAGVGLLVLRGEGSGEVYPLGVLLLMGSTFAWSLGSVWSRSLPLPRDTFLVSGMEMIMGGGALLAAGLLIGEGAQFRLAQVSVNSWVAFGYLVLFGSIVTFTAFAWLLRVSTPAKVSTSGYVNPMVAVLLGWVFRGEALSLRSVMASLVIVTAVVLIVTARDRRAPLPARAVRPGPATGTKRAESAEASSLRS